jgi:phage terminase small subunit
VARPAPPSPAAASPTTAEITDLRNRWLAGGRPAKVFDDHVKSDANLAAIRGIVYGVAKQRNPPDTPPPTTAPVTIRNTAAVEDSLPFGPAMSKLSPKRQAFVLALLQDDRDDGAAAARAAGYSDNGTSSKVIGSRLRHDPAVLAAIHETAVAQLSSLKFLATSAVRDVLADPATKAADRLKAASLVFDRSGMPAQGEHHIVVEHKRSAKEVIADIIALAKQLNMDPKEVLGSVGVTITDAEWTDVTEPTGSTEGLLDVL